MGTGAPAVLTPTLEVRRTIRAPRQRVFDAWTRAEEVKRFHACGTDKVSLAEIDLRVGGAFRVHMKQAAGNEHRVSGIYREIDPPRKVVYTWSVDGDSIVKDTLVTVEFHERGDATEVVLRHAIADDTERAQHIEGWKLILDKLEAEFSRG